MELLVFGLVVVYTGGAWKFFNGFNRTNFQRTLPNRLKLALLWPALFATNKSYRQNFRKALKGHK
ncbi:MAG: hypothetical protein KME46_06480 [Brasilonema angustatum HA4187-MV1]|jgi:hypothetical protein|nr:hypothetical protein [Brasilonema sp. CT11]MBW4592561.1 hypothetical protein [Brasilonema angustatum HA4187-MV1]